MSTSIVDASYDDSSEQWTVKLSRTVDGQETERE